MPGALFAVFARRSFIAKTIVSASTAGRLASSFVMGGAVAAAGCSLLASSGGTPAVVKTGAEVSPNELVWHIPLHDTNKDSSGRARRV